MSLSKRDLVIATLTALQKTKLEEQFKLHRINNSINDLIDEADSLQISIANLEQRIDYELAKHKEILKE